MKKILLAVMACSVLAGCKGEFNTDTEAKTDPVLNFSCENIDKGQDPQHLYLSFNPVTRQFLESTGNSYIMTPNKGDSTRYDFIMGESTTSLQILGNTASYTFLYSLDAITKTPDLAQMDYSFSCHKVKGVK
ncbi:hypothetical protein CWM57_00610 [Klebsiella sp. G-Nf4]|uniref:hypothetical protein n=1 Tax=unclassified Klebsiella TaxID=2608929 RepID=UPI000C29010D|nr:MULTISPECIES: hypothetical protein [unclassified Klebsiella]PJR56929.1 hypothetical protein CWM64_02435 [Klebsiella sp. I-Nf8]PJX71398.1 hypothetical protein CWM57_00610 [Klebsiella sp. G-Nf4]PJX76718.1 hypothetical protein CWM55_04550 [Klebsiella sp. G2-16S-Nf13]PKJ77341.1 hypothetical protein CWM65_07155 [Klebsiella sp. J-Nf11]